jgi:hypothetical protein
MIKYLVSIENTLAIGWASNADSVPYLDYVDITDTHTPDCAPEFWLIENSEIKIDQQKLIEFNRKNMPTLSPIEFDIKLNNNGLYDAVQELIKDNFEMRVAYNRATFFSRTASFVDQACIALGLTDEQVDEMWTS